ncbi:hypothetical protein SprV_0401578000 [Sparganum proliferum]
MRSIDALGEAFCSLVSSPLLHPRMDPDESLAENYDSFSCTLNHPGNLARVLIVSALLYPTHLNTHASLDCSISACRWPTRETGA